MKGRWLYIFDPCAPYLPLFIMMTPVFIFQTGLCLLVYYCGRVGCHFLLQAIFPDQGLNLHLLHWEVDSLPLSPLGSPLIPPKCYHALNRLQVLLLRNLDRNLCDSSYKALN